MGRRSPDREAIGRAARTDVIAAMPFGHSGEATMPKHRDAIIDLEDLEHLSRAEQRALWTQELAEKPPASLGRDILVFGVAYVRQDRRYGGLSKPVAKELDRLLARALGNGNDTPELPTKPLPRAGTILVREWQGTAHHVTVTSACSGIGRMKLSGHDINSQLRQKLEMPTAALGYLSGRRRR
jgi:hypothetical protein